MIFKLFPAFSLSILAQTHTQNFNLTEIGYIAENIAHGWKINWDCDKRLGQCHLNCEHDKFGTKMYKNAIKIINTKLSGKMMPIESVSCTYDEDISGCRTSELPQIPPGQWSCKVDGNTDKTCDLSSQVVKM